MRLASWVMGLGLGFAAGAAFAAEGMWLPSQAPEIAAELVEAGLQIPPQALADMNAAPMNAVVSLGGCSAAFVSPQGLIATNHHCAYGSIQYHSTPQQDYLTAGFLAKTLGAELPAAPGSRVLVMEALRDVSTPMQAGLSSGQSGAARTQTLERNRKKLIAACEEQPGRRCDVRPYFGGGIWYLQQMLEIQDVRLVYAPPGSVGAFGGDVDNWQWPRHSGDFSLYRAYVAPDGTPAAYSETNIPYQSRGHLKVATTDLKQGDFVLIAGYPGTTERYRTAGETKIWFEDIYPTWKRLLTEYSGLIESRAQDEADRIAYASLLRRAANYEKKIQGQIDAARAAGLLQIKAGEDAERLRWASEQPQRREYRRAISEYEGLLDLELRMTRAGLIGQSLDRVQMLRAARDLYRWAMERERPDAERALGWQERDRQALADRLTAIDRQYIPRIDQAILAQALIEVHKLPEADRNLPLERKIAGIGLDGLYAGTKLGDLAQRLAWLNRPAQDFRASDDPFIQVAVVAYEREMAGDARRREHEGRLSAARVAWMDVVRAHAAARGQKIYPDANGSLRFTYGHVEGRDVRDGAQWAAFTTTRGLLEKETGKPPFNNPPALLDLVRAEDWGQFASPALGTLPVNFLSSTDITNGNSGSAVLNARGDFVGLAFDGTLEGMLADWHYDPKVARSISVDARYMLWVMTKLDGADALVREMGVTVEKPEQAEAEAAVLP
ncbi:MAG: S46 family peptidase [Sphingomonadaceae bacterium]